MTERRFVELERPKTDAAQSARRGARRLPSREVAAIVLANADLVDYIPKRDTMAKLAALAKKHAVIREVIAPERGSPKLERAIARSRKSMKDLSALERKQLVVCGLHYDGKKQPSRSAPTRRASNMT